MCLCVESSRENLICINAMATNPADTEMSVPRSNPSPADTTIFYHFA